MLLLLAALTVSSRLNLGFDEAYNLNLAQTLARTGAYATYADGTYRPYDPGVTTGPVVLVPVSVALRVFGPHLTVVRAALVALFLLNATLIVGSLRHMFGWATALTSLVAVVTTPWFLPLGLRVMGEVSGLAFLLLGVALSQGWNGGLRLRRRVLQLCVGGLALGAAVLAKEIAAIMPVAMVLVAAGEFARCRSASRLARHAVPALIGLSGLAAWRGYQALAVQRTGSSAFTAWRAQVAARWTALRWWVMLAPLARPADATWKVIEAYWPHLTGWAVVLAGVLLLRRRLGSWPWSALSTPPFRALFSASSLWLLWFFVLSGYGANHRHLLIGICLGQIVVVRFTLWACSAVCSSIRQLRAAKTQGGGVVNPNVPRIASGVCIVLLLLLAVDICRGASWNRRYVGTTASFAIGTTEDSEVD